MLFLSVITSVFFFLQLLFILFAGRAISLFLSISDSLTADRKAIDSRK